MELLDPDRTRTFQLDPGAIYREVRSGPHPWLVHLLEVDLSRCEMGFRVEAARNETARLPVTQLARRAEPGVLAAVNGDFFTPEDRPLGVEASGGELRGRSTRPVFAWRPGHLPWIGPVAWSGDTLQLGEWMIEPTGRPDGRTEVVAGYPALLQDGAWVGDLLQGERPGFASQREPRTAVGVDPDGDRLWLVVVDGRRSGTAEGMTLPELARLLQALGVKDALNLDGGGSSVMVVRGQVVNRPSDLQGERSVVNALVVRRDPGYCSTWWSRDEE